MKPLFLAATLMAAQAGAAEIYKCTDASGRKTFSQTPCAAGAEKMTVAGPQSVGFAAPDSASIDALSNSNQTRDIDRRITNKRSHIRQLNAAMQEEIEILQDQARYTNNNLAGATLQSLGTRMQAVSARYTVEIDAVNTEIDTLLAEKKALSGTN